VKRRASRRAAALLVFFALASDLSAHDFWIEPSTFRPAVGEDFNISLRVGEHFKGEPVPRDDKKVKRFFVVSTYGEAPVPGLPATDPAGFAKVDTPGVAAFGYRSERTPITIEPEKFEKYLADEGLDDVLAARAKKGEKSKPGREVYSRSVKSVVMVGPKVREYDRRLGMAFEILIENDPAKWKADAPMEFRLLYDDKPLSGALVKAINRDDPDKTLTVRSGKNGSASFKLPRKGVWLVESVHMIPAPKDVVDADWESVWTSLTFEIP
jgi:uncharacterized GH25 family protein